jgi:hypothetical protein
MRQKPSVHNSGGLVNPNQIAEHMGRIHSVVNRTKAALAHSSMLLLPGLYWIERIADMSIRRILQANSPTLRHEVIGYSASGKTSIYTALKDMFNVRTPSGVFLKTVGDPSEFIRQRELTNRRIATATAMGMETTIGADAKEKFDFCATLKTETMFNGELYECMGQAIERPASHQEEYQAFVTRIPRADVLWIVLPLSQIDDSKAFGSVCQTCHSYLWHALEVRRDSGIAKPPVVAIVGTKMDTLGPSKAKVGDRLASLGLSSFGEIPGTLAEFGVNEAAIFPTTFFGCGKAVEVPGKLDEYKLSDPSQSPEPENIDSLMYWSLAAALKPFRSQASRRGSPSLSEVYDRLVSDLKKSEPISLGIVGDLIRVDE